MPRASLFLLLTVLVAGHAASLRANPPVAQENLSRGPMVQLTTRSSAVLVWRTVGPTIPLVRYGTSAADLDRVVLPVQMAIRVSPELAAPPELPRLSQAPPNTYQYEAYFSGLSEDTVYYYGIFDGDDLLSGCSEEFHFRTQPARDTARPLRFWVVGDSGTGTPPQIAAFNAMTQFVANEGPPLDAFLHLGDMAYNSGLDGEFQAKFFDIYASLLRNTVTWPTMGNHEGRSSSGLLGIGPYYDAFVLPRNGEAGGVPSGSEAFYSFDLGPIHFVCLNSHDEERSQVGRMATWLLNDLTQNDSDWLIAFWHHPPYTRGTHISDAEDQLIEMREVMMPILEGHGVDLVLAGHSHIYERSMLLDGAYATPTTSAGVILDDGDGHPEGDGAYRKSLHSHPHEGTVAVVAGHGRGAARIGLFPLHRKSIVEVGSVLLDLAGDTMTVRMINQGGTIRDEFQIIKRGEVAPRTPLADPWSPFGPALVTAERELGKTELHVFANPPADDAIVYFTLDGSEPTTASAVYSGPIELSRGATVNAFSVWRGGERVSPVSSKVIVPPVVGFVPHLRIPILASEDDATESDLGMVDVTGLAVGIDSSQSLQAFGLRFRDLPIPPGATIVWSRVEFIPAARGLELASWTVRADLSAPSLPFTTSIENLTARPLTTQEVIWSPAGWQRPGLFLDITADLSGMIEEVVHDPAWKSGDALTFLFSGTGKRLTFPFDLDPGQVPVLRIWYHELDPSSLAASVTPTVETEIGLDGLPRLFISFPKLSAGARHGLTYYVEGSPSLLPGSWEVLGITVNRFLPSPGPGWYHLRFLVEPPNGAAWGEAYFLRFRVTSQ